MLTSAERGHQAPMSALNEAIGQLALRYKLTNRETEIIYLLAAHGYSNKEIAARCFISEKTAKHHTEKIMQKIGTNSTRKLLSVIIGALAEDVG